MNCVYEAFEQHLEYIGEPVYADIFEKYKELKAFSHGDKPQYTFAGLIPWFYWQLLFEHNNRSPNDISIKIERGYLPSQAYMPQGTDLQRELMMGTRFWGKFLDDGKFTVAPAIYCMLNEQHAYFAEEIPSFPGARILFAVQLTVTHRRVESLRGDAK